MQTCFCCSLVNGCKCVAGYHFGSACLSLCIIIFSLISGEAMGPGMRAAQIIAALVIFLAALGLVYGLKKKDRRLLLGWMVIQGIRIAIEVGILIQFIYLWATIKAIYRQAHNYRSEDERAIVYDLTELKTATTLVIFSIVVLILDIILNNICLDAIRSYRAVLANEERNGIPVAYHIPGDERKRGPGIV